MKLNDKKAENRYNNLDNQLKKFAKHNNVGSYQTKEKYLATTRCFCKFLANNYGIEKFINVQSKHIRAYVDDMKQRDLSPATIKNNISGIRFFYDGMGGKNRLPQNDALDLQKRSYREHNRSWTKAEEERFQKVCEDRNNVRMAEAAILARQMGLRIHETLKINRSHVEAALRDKNGLMYVKGKGGLVRYVPLTETAKEILQNRIEHTERGHKLYLAPNEDTKDVKHQMENFINRHRSKWEEDRDENEPNRTYHGLRHTYASEQYDRFIEQGMNDYEARKCVSELLGHERDEVTRIYLVK